MRAELRETHAAWVLLLGDRAIKIKKPVKFEFLDFSTYEKRRHALERELELNRRLAPDVYRGIFTVYDESGAPVESALVMKRLPDEASIERLIESGRNIDDCISAVATKIARFHRGCKDSTTSSAIAAEATQEAVGEKWKENLADIRRFVRSILEQSDVEGSESYAYMYISGRKALFERRIEEGEIKDGHGDLLAADVFCIDSTPEILDCIEFDDRYRYCDVASEVGFFAMDLLRMGRTEEAKRFLRDYVRSYERPIPYSLVLHYIAYRASVRAKVACLSYEQGRQEAASAARRLVGLMKEYATRAVPLLVLVGGPPGTGKSALARALQNADRFASDISGVPRFEMLRSDVVRKALAGLRPEQRSDSALGQGIYSAEFTEKTYRAMMDRASAQLAMGRSVILDATFSEDRSRRWAAETAEKAHSILVELRCEAPPEICEARIRERLAEAKDPSEADEEIARVIRGRFDDWPSASPIDTSGTIQASLEDAIRAVEEKTGVAFGFS